VIVTTDASFEEDVLRSAAPVLVEFTAPWCQPCKAIEPFLADLERDHEGRLRVAQLDIEDHLATPARYGVLSLPTVMIFAGGEVVEMIDGAQPRRRYAEAVARVLGT
jgi:thioredoxin 1